MKFPAAALAFLILGCDRSPNPAEDIAVGQGNYSVANESFTASGRTVNLSECLSYYDAMAGKDPNLLTLSLSLIDSLYAIGTCMPVYEKGGCFILDQGILGSNACYPGTLTKRH